MESSSTDTLTGGNDGLTTAQIAGLIAFAVFTVQILFNLAWPLITVAFVTEKESAITWSVVSRMINNSYWPTILQTDVSATKGVRRQIVWQSWIMMLVVVLIGLTSIITPLGLHDVVVANKTPNVEKFQYVRDDYSALGLGTAPRQSSGFNRICSGTYAASNCPGANNNLTVTVNGSYTSVDTPTFYDISIPASYMSFWSRGISRFSHSVSSIFDIEYRTYKYTVDSRNGFFNNGSGYIVGAYRTMTNLFLNDAYEPVEGLIVDTKSGGIGFRNHTAPAERPQWGVQWTEDILFIEPVTECANMNLTLEYDSSATGAAANVTLVDNGGFSDLNQTYPLYMPDRAQEDPELAYRAYKGAWSSNAYTMLYLNITNPGTAISGKKAFSYINSQRGQGHPLETPNATRTSTSIDTNSIFTGEWAKYMTVPGLGLNGKPSNGSSLLNLTNYKQLYVPPNPWQITTENFTRMRELCQGALPGDYANISNVAGQCGIVMGIPFQKDGGTSFLNMPGTKYVIPLYNCASSTRAIIKTVNFVYNTTVGLRGLKVVSINAKNYSSPSEMPLWAVENNKNQTLAQTRPLWGLVDKEDTSFPNVSYKRAPHLWLTGAGSKYGSVAISYFNLPGTEFTGEALNAAYNVGPVLISNGLSDYSGRSSLPIFNRWKELTRTVEGASKVINLVWTDVAANAVVGTKSWASGYVPVSKPLAKRDGGGSNNNPPLVPVYLFKRVVRYKIVYAIPAFILLAFLLATLVTAIVLAITRRTSGRRVNVFLNRLAPGRIMTAFLDKPAADEISSADSVRSGSKAHSLNGGQKSSRWVKQHGKTRVDVSGDVPAMTGYSERVSREVEPSAKTAMLEKEPSSPKVQSIHEVNDGKRD